MYIKRLELENYRGFKNLVIDFSNSSKNLAVLVGVNGSGKSSVLDALATLLDQLVRELLSVNRRSPAFRTARIQGISESDINISSNSLNLKIETVLDSSCAIIPWQLSLTRSDYEPEAEIDEGLDVEESSSETATLQKNVNPPSFDFKVDTDEVSKFLSDVMVREDTFVPSPLLVYYKTHRIIVDSSAYDRYSSGRSYSAYRDALSTKEINSFRDFFNWFKDQEDVENEKRLREDPNYRLAELEVVRLAITKFLDGFPCSKFQDLRVERTIQETSLGRVLTLPSLTIKKNETKLRIDQLSDGEKNLLMLVLDIARRFTILNRGKGKSVAELLEGEGVVLIDEVDLHLHPSWQRTILPALIATFPNCQFIVTTHSPQVISSVPSESIFVLDSGSAIHNPGYTYGREANSILQELMGVSERIPKIQEKLDECSNLINDEKFAEAKEKLKSLRDVLGDTDPDIIYLSTTIAMFE
ncbi:MAG: DUF2813 domain-containing protein [Oscillatoriales cyanobacterium]|nr:MAG: DUF2813 domain-containing protein [Oscillatoriales cyanobacterium]